MERGRKAIIGLVMTFIMVVSVPMATMPTGLVSPEEQKFPICI